MNIQNSGTFGNNLNDIIPLLISGAERGCKCAGCESRKNCGISNTHFGGIRHSLEKVYLYIKKVYRDVAPDKVGIDGKQS